MNGFWLGLWIFAAVMVVLVGLDKRVDCSVGVKAACDRLVIQHEAALALERTK